MVNVQPIAAWLKRQYPHPDVDPQWLSDCCNALMEQNPTLKPAQLVQEVNSQFLLSSFSDSCLPNTGLPPPEQYDQLEKQILFGKNGCIVMVLSIMEIGHSAFQLQTTMENRREYLSGAGRIRRIRNPQVDGGEAEEEEEEEDANEIPPYPRGMLMLEVSDGYNVMQAMEYKRINGLTLGESALGSKMVLRGVQIRRGILMLTPENIRLEGHLIDELEAQQGWIFKNMLLRRMGKPELAMSEEIQDDNPDEMEVDQENIPIPAPAPPAHAAPPPVRHHNGHDNGGANEFMDELPEGAFDDFEDEFDDPAFDMLASGIPDHALGASGSSNEAPGGLSSGQMGIASGNRMGEEYEYDGPGEDDLEALMIMQERDQAAAQAPKLDGRDARRRALLAAMGGLATAGSSAKPPSPPPQPPRRLTLPPVFRQEQAPPDEAVELDDEMDEEETEAAHSRFFAKAEGSTATKDHVQGSRIGAKGGNMQITTKTSRKGKGRAVVSEDEDEEGDEAVLAYDDKRIGNFVWDDDDDEGADYQSEASKGGVDPMGKGAKRKAGTAVKPKAQPKKGKKTGVAAFIDDDVEVDGDEDDDEDEDDGIELIGSDVDGFGSSKPKKAKNVAKGAVSKGKAEPKARTNKHPDVIEDVMKGRREYALKRIGPKGFTNRIVAEVTTLKTMKFTRKLRMFVMSQVSAAASKDRACMAPPVNVVPKKLIAMLGLDIDSAAYAQVAIGQAEKKMAAIEKPIATETMEKVAESTEAEAAHPEGEVAKAEPTMEELRATVAYWNSQLNRLSVNG